MVCLISISSKAVNFPKYSRPEANVQGIKHQLLSQQKNNSLVFQLNTSPPQTSTALRLPFDDAGFLFLCLVN